MASTSQVTKTRNGSARQGYGIPPDLAAMPSLELWLDPGKRDPRWVVPVYGPHVVKGTRMVADQRTSSSSEFDPRQHPWLPTEFADIVNPNAAGDPRSRAIGFADTYGLIGAWRQGQAPKAANLETVFEKSAQVRRMLAALFPLGDLEAVQGRDRRVALGALTASIDVLRSTVRSIGSDDVRLREDLRLEFMLTPKKPLDLFELMNLQLLADISGGLRVLECEEPSCGKLFVWSKGRGGPRARVDLRGPLPRFCSFNHYKRWYRRAT